MNHEDHHEHPPRLYRDPERRIIAGVGSGIAAYLDCPPWMARTGMIALACFFPFATIIGYLAIALLLPAKPLRYRGHGDERSFWQSRTYRRHP